MAFHRPYRERQAAHGQAAFRARFSRQLRVPLLVSHYFGCVAHAYEEAEPFSPAGIRLLVRLELWHDDVCDPARKTRAKTQSWPDSSARTIYRRVSLGAPAGCPAAAASGNSRSSENLFEICHVANLAGRDVAFPPPSAAFAH